MSASKQDTTIVWVVHPQLKIIGKSNYHLDLFSEALALTKALPGTKLIGSTVVKVEKPSPREFFGRGKVEELALVVKANNVHLVIVNGQISPIQQQNLEKKWKVKILDRTALILEIFSERAVTKEGILQVEMAALTYQRSRLVLSLIHISEPTRPY